MEVERKFETVVTSGHENKDQRTSNSTWCGREGSDEAIHGRAARGLWASPHSQPHAVYGVGGLVQSGAGEARNCTALRLELSGSSQTGQLYSLVSQ